MGNVLLHLSLLMKNALMAFRRSLLLDIIRRPAAWDTDASLLGLAHDANCGVDIMGADALVRLCTYNLFPSNSFCSRDLASG